MSTTQVNNHWSLGGELVLDYLNVMNTLPFLINQAQVSKNATDKSESLSLSQDLKQTWYPKVCKLYEKLVLIKKENTNLWTESQECLGWLKSQMFDFMRQLDALLNLHIDWKSYLETLEDPEEMFFATSAAVEEWFQQQITAQ